MSETLWQRFRLGNVLLLWAVFRHSVIADLIPPVTQAIVLSCIAVHWQLLPMFFRGHDVHSVCISVYTLGYRLDYPRLLLAHFTHLDDIHLYFNLASLIVKGRLLERRFGSLIFLGMLCGFILTNTVLFFILQHVLAQTLNNMDYYYQCCVGLSGIVFALKMLTLYYAAPPSSAPRAPLSTQSSNSVTSMVGDADDDWLDVFGLHRLPRWLLPWFEIVLLQKLVPRAAFALQAAGILSGCLFVHVFMPYVGVKIWPRFRNRTFLPCTVTLDPCISTGNSATRVRRRGSRSSSGAASAQQRNSRPITPSSQYQRQQNNNNNLDDNFELLSNGDNNDFYLSHESYPFFGSNNTDLIDRLANAANTTNNTNNNNRGESLPPPTVYHIHHNSSSGGSGSRSSRKSSTRSVSHKRRRRRRRKRAHSSPTPRQYSNVSPHTTSVFRNNYHCHHTSPSSSRRRRTAPSSPVQQLHCVYNTNFLPSPSPTRASTPGMVPSLYLTNDVTITASPTPPTGSINGRRRRRRRSSSASIFGISDGETFNNDDDDDLKQQILRHYKVYSKRVKKSAQRWRVSQSFRYGVRGPLQVASKIFT